MEEGVSHFHFLAKVTLGKWKKYLLFKLKVAFHRVIITLFGDWLFNQRSKTLENRASVVRGLQSTSDSTHLNLQIPPNPSLMKVMETFLGDPLPSKKFLWRESMREQLDSLLLLNY